MLIWVRAVEEGMEMTRGRMAVAALSWIGLVAAVAAGLMAWGMLGRGAVAQAQEQERVTPIKAPGTGLPDEAASAGVKKFSFIAYGDTRGRRDGTAIQYEHSLIVDSMLGQIKKLQSTEYPVRFVLQSGDAVQHGQNAKEWNVSFTPLIDRLTTEGNVPYFLAPGNHDVSSAPTVDAPQRGPGLKNYLDAVSELIPRDGSAHRLSGYPTYSFGYGNTFVLGFDADIAGDEKQFAWVKAQLAGVERGRYTNIIVFCHQAPFSSGPHGGAKVEEPTVELRNKYMPLFQANHVRAVFWGTSICLSIGWSTTRMRAECIAWTWWCRAGAALLFTGIRASRIWTST